MKIITSKAIMMASLFGAGVVLSGCSCPNKPYARRGNYNQEVYHAKQQHHKQMTSQSPQITETVVFYQTYEEDDIDKVSAQMYTRSSRGGESKMGTIKFSETNDGLHMKVDLQDLRPGVTYTTLIYQCGACNDSICCDTAPMAIDLPTLKISQAGRLQKSYIIRGLTAAQLDNAKLILTRNGGYKAAWGTLK